MKFLLRLYPAAWRSRYETEVSALLDERPMHIGDAQDLLRGALDAHRHSDDLGLTTTVEGAASMSPRQTGWAAILAGVLWITPYLGAHVVGSLAQLEARGISSAEGAVFLLAFVGAPTLLVVAQASMVRAMSTAARRVGAVAVLIAALGATVMTVGLLVNAVLPDRPLVNDAEPTSEWWVIGMIVILFGSAAFGVVLLAVADGFRRAAIVIVAGSLLNGIMLIVSTAGFMSALRYSVAVALCGVVFGLAWVAVGMLVLRRRPTLSESPQIAAT